MTRLGRRIGFGLALGLGLLAGPRAGADDDKKTADEPKPAASPSAATARADWSGYARVTEITAEVVKADDNGLTLRISWLAPRGQRVTRPRLHYSHGMLYNSPGRQRPPQMTVHHHDYTIPYAPEGGVRTKSLPPKYDADGKRVAYTQEEREAMRAPSNAPGYAADKSDLKPGTFVDVTIVRDKKIAAEKVTEADLRVKYAMIIGQNPNPPKGSGANNKKKN